MGKRMLGVLFFTALSAAITVAAGGGASFLRRPVGVGYLALWSAWWVAIALGRSHGAPSRYDRSQVWVIVPGSIALVGFIAGQPWEYAHLSGPLPRDSWLSWVGLGLFTVGLALQVATFRTLGRFYTSHLGIQAGHHVVTTGPYRWVRHPGYLSNLVSLLGGALAMSSLLGLVLSLLMAPLVIKRIGAEEAMLREQFGVEYAAYAERTRWRLIPYLY